MMLLLQSTMISSDAMMLVCIAGICPQNLVRDELPRLRSEAERAAMLANIICEAYGNYMGAATVHTRCWTHTARLSCAPSDIHRMLICFMRPAFLVQIQE